MRLKEMIQRVEMWLRALAVDRWLHILAGVCVALLVGVVRPLAWAVWAFGLVAGIGKEIWDKRQGGEFDLYDIAATGAGAMLVQIALWLYLLAW